jgi:branched-chain amino acid transport system substrate-binding protein
LRPGRYLKRTQTVLYVAAVVAAAAGCSSGQAGSAAGAQGSGAKAASYTVTADSDLSGPSDVGGIALMNGFRAAIDTANSAGGAHGHKINVQVLDDASDLPTGLSNFGEAESSSSLGYFLPNASPIADAIAPKATSEKYPTVTVNSYMGSAADYQYAMAPLGPAYANTLASFAGTLIPNPHSATVGYLDFQSPSAQSLQANVAKVFADKGYKSVYSQVVPLTLTDFSVEAAAIAKANPSLFVMAVLDAQLVPLVTALRQRGYDGPIINWDTPISDGSLKTLNDKKLYVLELGVDVSNTKDASVAKVLTAAHKYGLTQGLDSSTNYIEGWVLANIVVAAIEKCGNNCTRQSFNTALENTTIPGAGLMYGNPGFSPSDHIMIKKPAVTQWDAANGYSATVQGFGF